MSGLEWADPPDNGNTRRDWDPIVVELRAAPGRWAVIARDQKSASHAIAVKQGRTKAFRPPGSFEARAIKTERAGTSTPAPSKHHQVPRRVASDATRSPADRKLLHGCAARYGPGVGMEPPGAPAGHQPTHPT